MTSNRQRRAGKSRQLDTHADRLPTQHEATDRESPDFEAAKVFEAVRDLLTTFATPCGDSDPAQNSESSALKMVRTMAWEIALERSPLTQYQSLALLAITIRWFGIESGRPETEILEVLAANFRHLEDRSQQELNDVIARIRRGQVDGEPPEVGHQG